MPILMCFVLILLSGILTKIFCILAKNSILTDTPNERSLHIIPKVRGGGIIFIGFFLIMFPLLGYSKTIPISNHFILLSSIFLVSIVSFIDDMYTLSAKFRLLVQCIASGLIAFFMEPSVLNFGWYTLDNPFLIGCFVFFATIWAINHFNFMDGIDGFCASQSIFLLFGYAILFSFFNAELYQDACLILITSLIGFLIFNFPPAKLFMGDVGSASLGLITFCIALIAQQKYQIPILYWFILNGLFLFDATITLVRRIINKEKWSAAHKKHAYQRLKQYGVDTRYILLGQALINSSFFIGVYLFQTNKIGLNLLLLFSVGVMVLIYWLIERIFPMYNPITN